VADFPFAIGETRSGIWQDVGRVIELTITDERLTIEGSSRSRTGRRAAIAGADAAALSREILRLCGGAKEWASIIRMFSDAGSGWGGPCAAYGPLAGIEDRPRPGKEPVSRGCQKLELASMACDKARRTGYQHECGPTAVAARHARGAAGTMAARMSSQACPGVLIV